MWNMQAPVDYPIQDAARTTQFSMDELTYSVLLDRMENNPHQQSAQASKGHEKARKTVILNTNPRLEPILRPFAEATQTLLSNYNPLVNVNTGVFSRRGRAQR